MNAVRATWKNGNIEVHDPVDWPEGCRLLIEPDLRNDAVCEKDEDWSIRPEDIAKWLVWYDSLEPLLFTPAEESDLAAWRKKVKDRTIATMHKGIEGVFE